jgi:lipopolysaccharide/colanic/teichoic acid biosynthesis glycosyltransferase
VPQEVIRYSEHELRRLSVVPGLTCLWQISGRSTIGFERWVELDLAYIDNMSFWNDLKIIAMTVPAVVSGRGAH